MNVFELRDHLIESYGKYVRSFIQIRDGRIQSYVNQELDAGLLWPDPLIQLNPSFEPGGQIDDFVAAEELHPECGRVFRKDKDKPEFKGVGKPLQLHRHQAEAIRVARTGANYVLTTGTGSGKSLAYIVPIVDHVLRNGSGRGIQAIVVYPMNALANSQEGELKKFLCSGYPEGKGPVKFARYTGQESDEEKQAIIAHPPDILLTNYVMLELLLTRPREAPLIRAAKGLRFLVLDELHTYRGRQGADVAMLVRRAREAFAADRLQCVGTSATLAGEGTPEEQRAEVARVATLLFGAPVQPAHVIGESLRRTTPERDPSDATFVADLRRRIDEQRPIPKTFEEFRNDPLSIWIESTFGLFKHSSGKLLRATPRTLSGENGAASELAKLVDLPVERCAEAIKWQFLGSYECEPNPHTGFPIFPFRFHQFISRGDTVYASLEPEDRRFVTVYGQQFVPNDRSRILLPLVFCRECGQEYYCVSRAKEGKHLEPRLLSEREERDESEPGFIYLSSEEPWPEDPATLHERLPEDWLEEHRGAMRVRKEQRKWLPLGLRVKSDGSEGEPGITCHFIPARFQFCLNCGVTYSVRNASDFAKLAVLGTEGRSTATTILSLSAIRYLRKEKQLPERARKLLSFTDNRQDASLQAGHFNDFIEIGLLRSALYRAASAAGPDGLRHEILLQKVFDALDLPLQLYASNPNVKFQPLEETKSALRQVLGYRLYRDQQRGWRITSPNLEQCGLLEIRYLSLKELCASQEIWANLHPALATAEPTTRQAISKALLDYMRRELAIKVTFLEANNQERIQLLSAQHLIPPWALDENETLEKAAVLFPRSVRPKEFRSDVYLSARGRFGQYLRRSRTFHGRKVSVEESQTIILHLLGALKEAGLVEEVEEPRDKGDPPGYQLPASAMVWVAGEGKHPLHDPIRVPRAPKGGSRSNQFFVEFYRTIAGEGAGLEAREHTAQVDSDRRQEREERFREGRLPILYCSPTMELGVDISELNVVNMRNIPPTPANYAQRSGRAGRSGQPALVFSYCSTFRSHDQYFFRRPHRMVAGSVMPPRLDLANEDLIRAHLQAIWLAETGQDLGKSLTEVLDLSGSEPSLALLPSVSTALGNPGALERARARIDRVLGTIGKELQGADWYCARWPEEVLNQVLLQFDRACDRWRSLYRAAKQQSNVQHAIIHDNSKLADEKDKAKRLRAEAEAQMALLSEARNAIEGDFYSYRYFASEGFLPGYNFPRLPLSAYIPGQRKKKGRNEFLSRPRFLAISEFGPRAIVYHEGSRYRINKVILPVLGDGQEVLTTSVKQCASCGYLHPLSQAGGPDLCERCGRPLDIPVASLFRLENVSTKRADRISSDEEERQRLGYDIRTGLRFTQHGGRPSRRLAKVFVGAKELAELTYGHAATLWRMNFGSRSNPNLQGFFLDVERGYWKRNERDPDDTDTDPLTAEIRRVIPYVEDRRNALLLEFRTNLDEGVMASLQATMKNAIQVEFQLEDSEVSAEPLPTRDTRNLIVFYEAAEGGAGVLRRFLDDPEALSRVARQALQLCHFDPATGADLRRSPRAREDCEAACYDCLMSYGNQWDHKILDRRRIRDLLLELTHARLEVSPGADARGDHYQALERQCQSQLEKSWLSKLEELDLRLPSRAQILIERCKTRPDFLYDEALAAVYVDGPFHEFPERQDRDKEQDTCMEDHGYTVIRFKDPPSWTETFRQFPNIFGRVK